MISFITAIALLLIPILILLIVRVRRRQRIIYTHTFLQPLNDRPLREFLLRTFQLYYDVAADLLLALLLALFLCGLTGFLFALSPDSGSLFCLSAIFATPLIPY